MLAITEFYGRPQNAEGFRAKNFTDWHRNGWDSGGFQILMGKIPLSEADPMKTVEIYKRVGVKEQDFPIQLDLPPRYDFSHEEKMSWIEQGALFYHTMRTEIPFVVPVVHGWTYEEISHSLELIEDPDKLCTGTNIPLSARNKQGPFSLGASDKSHVLGTGSLAGTWSGINIWKHVVSSGTFAGTALDWSMGNLNPHSSIVDRLATPVPNGVDFGQTPVIDRVKSKAIAVGSFASPETIAVDEVISSRPRTKVVGIGAFLQSSTWVCDHFANTPQRKRKKEVLATPLPGKVDVGIRDKVHFKKEVLATPVPMELTLQRYRKKYPPKKKRGSSRAPLKAIIERLALVLNMLRDRTLFMLGGASPNMQHMIFMGGATFSDTSAWRIKGYFGEIYIPGRGARAIGYKATSKRPEEEDLKILRECLRDPTHPFHGMPLNRFLEIGHYNVGEWRKTWPKNKWEVKPFPLRALHNAWVLKKREEVTANEYESDPDRYHKYLLKRFENNPQLKHRLKNLWTRLKRPYVQTDLGIFLKGEKPA